MALKVGKKYSLRRPQTPQRLAAAERRKASIRRTITGTLVLALLIGAGGIAYTWYMGKNKTAAFTAGTPVPSRRVEMKPLRQDPKANVGVSVQMLSTPVQPGQNASISIRTNQLAVCTIVVKYGEVASTDSGLSKKTADDYGTLSWSWTVPVSTPEGKGSVKVDCANKAKSGSVTADLIVKR